MGITNTVGSAIARTTDCGIYLNCGPEIGVASTKAYTSQIIALTLMALQLGEHDTASKERRKNVCQGNHILSIKSIYYYLLPPADNHVSLLYICISYLPSITNSFEESSQTSESNFGFRTRN